jgi:GNAT superfamily N-acetyltransferase
MSISKAKPQDVQALNTLINSAYRGEESKKGWSTEEKILGGIRIDEETILGYFNQENVQILKYTEADDIILGTVYLEIKGQELYLGMFAVSPILQGKGIGKLLLAEAEHIAQQNGCDRIAITVIDCRIELIEWYERCGFAATGNSIAFEEIKDRFGEPKQDNIRLISMVKILA